MKILSAVLNNIETDQRLDKVCRSLLKFGYEVELIGATLKGKPLLDKPYATHLIEMKNQHSMSMYAEFNKKLLFTLLNKVDKETILLANDLDSLLPFYLVSKWKNLPLVFDSHEIFSELPSLHNRPKTKKVWKTLEQFLLPKIKNFYTVSDSYAAFFAENYQVSPKVVRNVPTRIRLNQKQNHIFFPLPPNPTNKNVILYQGAINMSRGIDKVIEAFRHLDNEQLWIIGDGPKKQEYEQLTQKLQLTDMVFFLGRIKPELLKTITPLASIGLSIEEDFGLSYRYALPNKLFDYIQAQIPILGSPLPEIKKIIEHYQIGLLIENHTPEHLASKIKELLNKGREPFLEQLMLAANELCWENEELVLKEIFEQIKV